MNKVIAAFIAGVIAGTIGMSTLSASNGGGGWTDRDVFRAIQLLEKIAANTAR